MCVCGGGDQHLPPSLTDLLIVCIVHCSPSVCGQCPGYAIGGVFVWQCQVQQAGTCGQIDLLNVVHFCTTYWAALWRQTNKTRIFIYSLSDQAIDLHIVIPRDQNKSQVSI